jgi:hypothetical protein
MAVENNLACYDKATITAEKCFIVPLFYSLAIGICTLRRPIYVSALLNGPLLMTFQSTYDEKSYIHCPFNKISLAVVKGKHFQPSL